MMVATRNDRIVVWKGVEEELDEFGGWDRDLNIKKKVKIVCTSLETFDGGL